MEIKYEARSPWLERFLNEVAERKYLNLHNKSVTLEQYDESIWDEMKPQIIKEFHKDLIIVSYNRKDSDWVLCTIVQKWATEEHDLKANFNSSPNRVRVCCAYKLLFPRGAIKRSPEPYWDFVPNKYMRETVRAVKQFRRIGKPVGVTKSNDDDKTVLKHVPSEGDGDRQTTTRTESNIAIVDLFDLSMDTFNENCKLI